MTLFRAKASAAPSCAGGRVLVSTAILAAFLLLPVAVSAAQQLPQDRWVTTGAMAPVPRYGYNFDRLGDGRAVVAGGEAVVAGGDGTCGSAVCTYLDLVEIYDWRSDTWTLGPSLPSPAYGTISLTLADGRILHMGGNHPSGRRVVALNREATAWERLADLPLEVGYLHVSSSAAALLPDGSVAVIGSGSFSGSSWVYEPRADAWRRSGAMRAGRQGFTATALADGRVLVVGGNMQSFDSDTLIYDPDSGAFSDTTPMRVNRTGHRALLLGDGRVLIAGGYESSTGESLENMLYDPGSETWRAAGGAAYRAPLGLVGLQDGRVLLTGADYVNGNLGAKGAQVFDPATNVWTPAAPPANAHVGGALLLPDGSVLQAGAIDGEPTFERWLGDAEESLPPGGNDCDDVLFLGVRGSGEQQDEFAGYGRTVAAVREEFERELQESGLSVDYDPIDYTAGHAILPRDGLFLVAPLTDPLWWSGMETASLQVSERIRSSIAQCGEVIDATGGSTPRQRIVLAGYSQGALAIRQAISELQPDELAPIASVVLIADPRRIGDSPVNRGSARNRYNGITDAPRLLRPDIRPHPDVPIEIRDVTHSWCKRLDGVCEWSDLRFSALPSAFLVTTYVQHTSYSGHEARRGGRAAAVDVRRHSDTGIEN